MEHRPEIHVDERMRHAANSVLRSDGPLRVPADGWLPHGGAMPWRLSRRKLSRSRSGGSSHLRSTLRYAAGFRCSAPAQLPGSYVSGVWLTLMARPKVLRRMGHEHEMASHWSCGCAVGRRWRHLGRMAVRGEDSASSSRKSRVASPSATATAVRGLGVRATHRCTGSRKAIDESKRHRFSPAHAADNRQ